jgi:hypothetical protein
MATYLLNIYQPDGPLPDPEFLSSVSAKLDQLNARIRDAGSWVFSGGLHGPDSATVVRTRDGSPVITDGPYLEGKEHIGGFWVVDAPDLDTVIAWAREASEATTLPIEVRPFRDSVQR